MPYALELGLDDRAAAEAELTRFAGEAAPVPITLASVRFFPQVALFLAPTVTAALLEMQAGLHARLRRIGAAPWGHTQPGGLGPPCNPAHVVPAVTVILALVAVSRCEL